MDHVTTPAGIRLRIRIDGHRLAPVLLLSNSLGSTLEMWDPQVKALAERFRVIRYDTRGHGGSDACAGPVTIDDLGADALSVLDAVGADRAAICGLSLGGATGLWLAQHQPHRIARLVVANSAAIFPPADAWTQRITTVEAHGMSGIVEALLGRWLTDPFRQGAPAVVDRLRGMLLSIDPAGYAACCAAVRDLDLRAGLGRVHCPLLVIVGDQDPATPPAAGIAIAEAVPGSRLVSLAAAHLSNWEQPAAFTDAVVSFLIAGGTHAEADRLALGFGIRRQVLGDGWVDAALANRTELTADFQDFITRYAWGEVWSRPGLDRPTRSCIVLAITVALGRWDEFRLHVRGALNNGLGVEQLREVIIQAAIYAGVPAANTAMHEAQKVLREIDADRQRSSG